MPSHTLNPAALSGASAPSVAPTREYVPVDAGYVQRLIDQLQDQLDGTSDVPVTHYAPGESITEAIVEGTNVTSYCGVRRAPVPSSTGAKGRPCDLCCMLQGYGLRMAP